MNSRDIHKMIIDNRSELSDINAIKLVSDVMSVGFISGVDDKKQYCYVTRFPYAYAVVICEKNKNSFRFIVVDDERGDKK